MAPTVTRRRHAPSLVKSTASSDVHQHGASRLHGRRVHGGLQQATEEEVSPDDDQHRRYHRGHHLLRSCRIAAIRMATTPGRVEAPPMYPAARHIASASANPVNFRGGTEERQLGQYQEHHDRDPDEKEHAHQFGIVGNAEDTKMPVATHTLPPSTRGISPASGDCATARCGAPGP